MAIVKQLPEDFIVEELQPGRATSGQTGEYSYFWLTKRNLTTFQAVQAISDSLKIAKDRIGFAGVKDKNAITRQLVSIRNSSLPKEDFRIGKNIKLSFACLQEEPLGIGQLAGNQFKITVRNLSEEELAELSKNYEALRKLKAIPNYFDEQRFSHRNKAIGKALITNNMKAAVAAVLGCGVEQLNKDYYKSALKQAKGFEAAVLNELIKNPNDFNAAFKVISFQLRKLFVHAYQAYLFNTVATRHMQDTLGNTEFSAAQYSLGTFVFPSIAIADKELPIIGFATEFNTMDKKLAQAVANLLKEEGITPRSFLVKSMPEISSEGGQRHLLMRVKNLSRTKAEDDDLNSGKKKCMLSFSLGKGCYATMVVKSLLAH